MVGTVFSGAFVLGYSSFEFYLSYLVFMAFIVIYVYYKGVFHFNRGFLFLLLYFAVVSFLCITVFKSSSFLLLKQLLGISFSASAYYLLIKNNDYDVEGLFRLYLKFALLVAALGVFQEISYLLNFQPGYDWKWFIPKSGLKGTTLFMFRINSIMPEPSMLAMILAPAVFVVLSNLFSKRKIYLSRLAGAIILAAYFLTFSSVAYLGLIVGSLLILYQKGYLNIKRRKIVLMPVIIAILFIVFYSVYGSIPDIKSRVDAFVALLNKPDQTLNFSTAMDRNASVLILYSNVDTALNSVKKNPLFGSGLGTHADNFDKYYGGLIEQAGQSGELVQLRGWGLGVSKEDANSLFVRLLSETGIIGLSIVIWLLLKFFIKRKDPSAALASDGVIYNLSVINNGIFLLIILRLIRFGHYFVDGLFFFAFIYYFTNKEYSRLAAAPDDRVAAT
ncbi:MAG: O-antigen ligase family protein [Candidatus Margulisbacteria bacterium]|nr:O-antigen ligase family protein [Candidatus Margulisiibacteriota bacterium]